MPIKVTVDQKKALLAIWPLAKQAPIQFALVAAPDPLIWFYKKRQDAPNAAKVLAGLKKSVEGFQGTAVVVGQVSLEGATLRVVADLKRCIGPKLLQAAFVKAWKLGAKALGLDYAAQLIDKALFTEEESEEAEPEEAPSTGGSSEDRHPGTTNPALPTPVAINRSKMVWTSAPSTASSEFDKLLKAIYSDPEVRADPDMRAAAGEIEKVGWKMDAFDDRLIGALDALAGASEASAQSAALERCMALIRGYRAALEGDQVLQEIDDNPFAKVKIRASLHAGLQDLDRALQR